MIFHGYNIRSDKDSKDAKLIDVFPTILFPLNVTILEDLDVRVLSRCFKKLPRIEYIKGKVLSKRDSRETGKMDNLRLLDVYKIQNT